MKKIPLCLHCEEQNVRKGSDFCTQRCAAAMGEMFREGAMDMGAWCPTCEEWVQGEHEHEKVTP